MADFLELLNGVVDTAKEKITELAKEEIENKEKKVKLDEVITAFVENMLTKVKLNFFVKLCIKKLVLPHISEITQVIYDLLKAKITGETEETKEETTDVNKGKTKTKEANK